jgi:hypothetical protein
MTTTHTPARSRLLEAEVRTAHAHVDFEQAVAAMLAVGSEVTHNLRVLGEEVAEGVLDLTLDNIEHLARLADKARHAKERLADAAYAESAARYEAAVEDEENQPWVRYASGYKGRRNAAWIAWAKAYPHLVDPRDRDKVPA